MSFGNFTCPNAAMEELLKKNIVRKNLKNAIFG